MKIIVLGSTGMLGSYLSKYFSEHYQVININKDQLNALNATYEDIHKILKLHISENMFVINCMGIIPQRADKDNIRSNIKVNALFPHLLANICEKINCFLLHISTDCVYNGEKGNYTEDDEHNETNLYGISKSLGEPSNCCIIRTSIIGEEKTNKKSLLEWVKSQKCKKIYGFANHYWNGVTCLQLAKIIHHMIKNNIYWTGVRHIYSPNIITKYELVKMISDIYNLDIIVEKQYTKYTNKVLSSKYNQIINIPDIYQQIKELHDFEL